MAMLSREDIERNSQLKTQIIHIPEWNGDVMIRELTGEQRDRYENSITGNELTRVGEKVSQRLSLHNVRARLVSMCLIDPEKQTPLYSEKEIGLLGNKSAAALDRLFDACQKLSGITDEDMQEMTAQLSENGTENFGTP